MEKVLHSDTSGMRQTRLLLLGLCALSAVLMSLPWLCDHCGALSLVGLIPLLYADRIADSRKVKRFFLYHYFCFVLWNALTTFWVCFATIGGGVFACLANALQMSLIWTVFRLSKRKFSPALSCLFLVVMWIAWERAYMSAQISWPWLTLGNAFARSPRSVQWYEFTGTLGGSLWIWLCNLSVFGLSLAVRKGKALQWTPAARITSMLATIILFCAPLLSSKLIYASRGKATLAELSQGEGSVKMLVAQPNFSLEDKFTRLSQIDQTREFISLVDRAMDSLSVQDERVLIVGPETFCSGVMVGQEDRSESIREMEAMLSKYPLSDLLIGVSAYEIDPSRSKPHPAALPWGEGWYLSRNSALLLSSSTSRQIYHKSRLVPGVESLPYPEVIGPLDSFLAPLFGAQHLCGRCIGQKEASLLNFRDSIPIAGIVCYENVYGEYCAEFVRKGAKAIVEITNDAWWGTTPGRIQHMSFSALRAIETRRDYVRCGNTGISAHFDSRGELVSRGGWNERQALLFDCNLSSEQTFFTSHGDICGRVCTLAFLLMIALLAVRFLMGISFRGSKKG